MGSKVILYGIYYTNDCGYTAEQRTMLATFDSQSLAEDYVIASIVSSEKVALDVHSSDYHYTVCQFKTGSLFKPNEDTDYHYYSIESYNIPHNPTV